MKNAFEYEAELAALQEELEQANDRAFRASEAHVVTMSKLADAERLLTRARIYARGEFRDEIDVCLKELNRG